MSYTRNYTISVPYSGSVVESYPASEHGGTMTVYYDGHASADIEITVQTEAFERSVRRTNEALGAVAGALSAAEAAQVATIRKGAQHVAETTTRGFFRVLGGELSSSIAGFASRLKSSVGLLAEQGHAIEGIHRQMEGDYQAIKGRYLKIFDELDRELDRRIRELDRPAFELSQRAMGEVVTRPVSETAGQAFLSMSDTHATALKLQSARAKERSSEAVGSLGQVCRSALAYQADVAGVSSAGDEAACFLPVVFSVQRDLDAQFDRIHVEECDAVASDAARVGVMSYVANAGEGSWAAPREDERQAIEAAFLRYVDEYATHAAPSPDRDRVCQTMLRMFRQAPPQTLRR